MFAYALNFAAFSFVRMAGSRAAGSPVLGLIGTHEFGPFSSGHAGPGSTNGTTDSPLAVPSIA